MSEAVKVTTEVRPGEPGQHPTNVASSWELFRAKSFQLDIPTPDPYVPCNPCPLWIDDELVCSVRAVDYRLGTPCQRSSSINFLAHLDINVMGLVKHCMPLGDGGGLSREPGARTRGFEDLRLFIDEDDCLSALATACDVVHGGLPEMCKLGINRRNGIETAQVLRGPWSRYPQKNWTPIADNPHVVLYRMYPTCELSYDEIDWMGRAWLAGKFIAHDVHDFVSSSIRGSSQAVPMDGGYLVIVHEHKTKRPLSYVHRFLWLDSTLEPRKVSKEFTWQTGGVEFCCGMTSKDGENFVAGYGVHDSAAYIATFHAADVRKILQPL